MPVHSPSEAPFQTHYNPEKPQECLTEYDKVKASELLTAIFLFGFVVFFLLMSLTGNIR
jgi:hypothetical protein